MQCPICKRELEIKNKKVGETESGEAIYNEFAICRDCKKQWNLDKQRAKKKAAQEALAKEAEKAQQSADTAKEVSDSTQEKPRKKRPAADGSTPSSRTTANGEAVRPKKKRPRPETDANGEPVKSAHSDSAQERPRKKRPVDPERPLLKYADASAEEEVRPRPKKKRPENVEPAPRATEEPQEQTYSNIPPKHVREKREEEMRENYQTMLDEGDEDEGKRFPIFLVVILVILIVAAAAFAGYWFLLR